jgi:hypothetical protein
MRPAEPRIIDRRPSAPTPSALTRARHRKLRANARRAHPPVRADDCSTSAHGRAGCFEQCAVHRKMVEVEAIGVHRCCFDQVAAVARHRSEAALPPAYLMRLEQHYASRLTSPSVYDDVRSVRRVMVYDTVKDHPSSQAASDLSQSCLRSRALFARSVLPDRGSSSRNGLGEPQQVGNTLDRAVLLPPFLWGCPNKSPRLRLVGAWCTEALFPRTSFEAGVDGADDFQRVA